MCKCGCGICENKKPKLVLKENNLPKNTISYGLNYHISTGKPLYESIYKEGSKSYFKMWRDARTLYSRGILEVNDPLDYILITETKLGYFDENEKPLDYVDESYDSLGKEDKLYIIDDSQNKIITPKSLTSFLNSNTSIKDNYSYHIPYFVKKFDYNMVNQFSSKKGNFKEDSEIILKDFITYIDNI